MSAKGEFTSASALVLLTTVVLLVGGYAGTAMAPIPAPPRVTLPSSVEAQPAPMPIFPTLPSP
jgi:hypothetical protein